MDEAPARTEPQLIPPAEWKAVPTRFELPPRGPLDHLVLHHTAFPGARIGGRTLAAEARHMREIQRWHLDRGWATVGYHFVVSPSGRIFGGRPVDRLGAHVQGHNAGTVGICLMGDFTRERPTAAALAALEHVRTELVPGGEDVDLLAHNDHRGHERNACPGRYLEREGAARRRLPRAGPARR